jgi:hypothetical protein
MPERLNQIELSSNPRPHVSSGCASTVSNRDIVVPRGGGSARRRYKILPKIHLQIGTDSLLQFFFNSKLPPNIPRCPLSTHCLAMIHVSALHGNLILAALGRIAVQKPDELAMGSMSYGLLASNVLNSASNLLSASLPEGMLGGYDLEEVTVIMPGLGIDAKVVGLLATWAAGGVGTSSEHPGRTDGPDLPLVFYDPSTSSSGQEHQPYRLADLELHDVRPRREDDETVYVDNSQVASWLAELELTDLERKAYVFENSVQGVGIFSFFFPLLLPSTAPACDP